LGKRPGWGAKSEKDATAWNDQGSDQRIERGMFFGESKASPKYPGVSSMYFRDIVAGLDSRIYYFFSQKEEVFRIVYVFQRQHVDRNRYIGDYLRIRTMLIRLYGEPKIDGRIWDIDFYRDKPDEWGTAIAYGHMHYRTGWEDGGTLIRLTLCGIDLRIRHELTFTDRNRIQEVKSELGKIDP
jgi:hypothetical protein